MTIKYITHRLLACMLLLMCFSCVEEDDAAIGGELVVEGWIEEGEYPIVYLGKSMSMDNRELNDLNEYVIKWGKVTIIDGEDSVVLTGTYDNRSFPPYYYTTPRMVGQAGHTYTLKVDYRGLYAQATTTIPYSVPIDSARVVQADATPHYSLQVFFNDRTFEHNYYALFSQRVNKDKTYLLSFMGVLNDEVAAASPTATPGVQSLSAHVYRGYSVFTDTAETKQLYFDSTDVVRVKLRHMDRESYDMWQSFSNQLNFSSNMFFPYTENLKTNIQGGKGYWCGFGIGKYNRVIVPVSK